MRIGGNALSEMMSPHSPSKANCATPLQPAKTRAPADAIAASLSFERADWELGAVFTGAGEEVDEWVMPLR
jgi:hypothetical protein